MPGRPRKPTALKRQQGTEQKCRTNPNEPELPPELPAPPDGLSKPVLDAYMAHGQRLLDMRVLTRADAGALLGIAQAYVDWREACDILADADGPIIEEPVTDNGKVVGHKVKHHPAVAIRNEADRRYRSWCQSFGLTPADRSKVSAKKGDEPKGGLAKVLEMTG